MATFASQSTQPYPSTCPFQITKVRDLYFFQNDENNIQFANTHSGVKSARELCAGCVSENPTIDPQPSPTVTVIDGPVTDWKIFFSCGLRAKSAWPEKISGNNLYIIIGVISVPLQCM